MSADSEFFAKNSHNVQLSKNTKGETMISFSYSGTTYVRTVDEIGELFDSMLYALQKAYAMKREEDEKHDRAKYQQKAPV